MRVRHSTTELTVFHMNTIISRRRRAQGNCICVADHTLHGSIPQQLPLGVAPIGDVLRRYRLRWHGHVERRDDADYVKACTRLVVEGKTSVDRPRKTWQNTVCRHASAES